jgi:nitroreductase
LSGDNVVNDNDLVSMVETLMQSRQTILPKRLFLPAPDGEQLQLILNAAASAPDHGQLLPWRFVIVPESARPGLAEVFGAALRERDPDAIHQQVEQAKEKAFRSPLLLLMLVNSRRGDPDVDLHERIVSAGCAVQNVLLMATALGFGSALTSGKALKSGGLRAFFNMQDGEHALCFVSIGTVLSSKPAKLRPTVSDYVTTLGSDRPQGR